MFVTCADDIELFDSQQVHLNRKGFTALAHPSSIKIAESHGVFVLDQSEKALEDLSKNPRNRSIFLNSCLKFLHKPKEKVMREANAILVT